jgi:hypothetical protein
MAVRSSWTHDIVKPKSKIATNRVSGRAAAIAADKQSFDLCDDALGEGVSKTLNDPEYLKRFGSGSAVRGPESAEKATNGTSH